MSFQTRLHAIMEQTKKDAERMAILWVKMRCRAHVQAVPMNLELRIPFSLDSDYPPVGEIVVGWNAFTDPNEPPDYVVGPFDERPVRRDFLLGEPVRLVDLE